MTRWRTVAGAALCLLSLLPAAGCGRGPAGPPGIVFIMVDTLRADYLGSYGFQGSVTPNLDLLAEQSVLFTSAFTQAPWTKPAVASLFTSLYPQVHGLTNHEGKYWSRDTEELETGILAEGAVTLAERLREAGYRTGAFISNHWLVKEYGFAQGFEIYHEKEAALNTTVEHLADDARAWLDSLGPDEPFFLYMHFMDVHAPYSAPRSDFEVLRNSPTVGSDRRLSDREVPYARWQNIEHRPGWATDEMRHGVDYWRTRYASGVRAFDRRLGAFLESLRQAGRLEQSVLVVTSDHGEELFEHRSWSHGQNLFDHQLHIPLLVRNPGGSRGGTRVDDIVELVDLMPTLLALASAEPVEVAQGRDISSHLGGKPLPGPGVTFATATQRTPGLYSLRTRSHKLVYDVESRKMNLFDVRADPGESRDILQTEQKLGVALTDELLTWISDSVAGGTLDTETKEIPDDLRDRLEALGYLQ